MDSTEFAITFFTALTVMANAATLGLVGLALAARLTGPGRAPTRAWRRLRDDLTPPVALGLAALVAGVATAGSLYFSEGAGFIPCRLCWVQRGFMYPLVLVLALAALMTHRSPAGTPARWLRRLAVATAAVGGAVSVWHLLIERFPDLESATSCDISNPCSLVWFERLGFVTLPYMALSGFLLVVALTALAIFTSRPASGTHFSSSRQPPRPTRRGGGAGAPPPRPGGAPPPRGPPRRPRPPAGGRGPPSPPPPLRPPM
jgi:disulfide bond formation protein DsbB